LNTSWQGFWRISQNSGDPGRRDPSISGIFGDDRFVDVVLAEAESLPDRKPDVNAVVAAVKRLYGLSGDRLGSRGREREICETRALQRGRCLRSAAGS